MGRIGSVEATHWLSAPGEDNSSTSALKSAVAAVSAAAARWRRRAARTMSRALRCLASMAALCLALAVRVTELYVLEQQRVLATKDGRSAMPK